MSYKDDFIAKYGEEAYQKKLGSMRKYAKSEKGKLTRKLNPNQKLLNNAISRKWVKEHADLMKSRQKEYYENNKELCCEKAKIYIAERIKTDKIFVFKRLYVKRRSYVSNDIQKMKCNELIEAIGNSIVKEAEREGNPYLANPDFLYERFKNNCKYNLMYGNWQILKYFIRHMQIKIYMDLSGHPNYTDHDKEMYSYFRSLQLTPANKCLPNYIAFMDDVFFDVPEDIKEKDDFFRKAILLEDMIRNAKMLDLYQPEIFWFTTKDD